MVPPSAPKLVPKLVPKQQTNLPGGAPPPASRSLYLSRMSTPRHIMLFLTFLLPLSFHLTLAPYSKVEESFHTHAVHDLMYVSSDLSVMWYNLGLHSHYPGLSLSQICALPDPSSSSDSSTSLSAAAPEQSFLSDSRRVACAVSSSFDHTSYPGVVPRSFVPSAFLSSFVRRLPFFSSSSPSLSSKVSSLFLCRLFLSLLAAHAHYSLALSLASRVPSRGFLLAFVFALVTAVCPHVNFYGSRLVGNAFASVLTTYAAAAWLRRGDFVAPSSSASSSSSASFFSFSSFDLLLRSGASQCVALLVFAVVVVRADVLLLLLPVALSQLYYRRIRLPSLISASLIGLQAAALLAGPLDSALWDVRSHEFPHSLPPPPEEEEEDSGVGGFKASLLSLLSKASSPFPFLSQYLWCEGAVLFQNGVNNMSDNYGTYPFHWYFSNALPRALGFFSPLLLFGVLSRAFGGAKAALVSADPFEYLVPSLLFVVLFSLLGHKELRFVLPVFPLLNAAVADVAVLPILSLGAELFKSLAATRASSKAKKTGGSSASAAPPLPSNPPTLSEVTASYRRLGSYALLPVSLLLLASPPAALVGNALLSALFLKCSKDNYPGGVAVSLLNKRVASVLSAPGGAPPGSSGLDDKGRAMIYLDVLVAQTGATRFHELPSSLASYSKGGYEEGNALTERWKTQDFERRGFTHLVVKAGGTLHEEASGCGPGGQRAEKTCENTKYYVLEVVEAFERFEAKEAIRSFGRRGGAVMTEKVVVLERVGWEQMVAKNNEF